MQIINHMKLRHPHIIDLQEVGAGLGQQHRILLACLFSLLAAFSGQIGEP